jgi:hypothetical protein
MTFYVRIFLSIDPDHEFFVGPFGNRGDRARWCRREMPADLRSLNTELGVRGKGITASRTEPCDRGEDQPAPADSIKPRDFKTEARRLYHDVYVTY